MGAHIVVIRPSGYGTHLGIEIEEERGAEDLVVDIVLVVSRCTDDQEHLIILRHREIDERPGP